MSTLVLSGLQKPFQDSSDRRNIQLLETHLTHFSIRRGLSCALVLENFCCKHQGHSWFELSAFIWNYMLITAPLSFLNEFMSKCSSLTTQGEPFSHHQSWQTVAWDSWLSQATGLGRTLFFFSFIDPANVSSAIFSESIW